MIFLLGVSPAESQNHLDRKISVANVTSQPLGDVLKQIGKENGFYFSYNSRSVVADSLVSIKDFHGTLQEFLEKTLGTNYEFREIPGYVIIRYAPGTLDVVVQSEKETGRSFMIKGYVRDSVNGKGIEQASVYDRKALVSTLSDQNGYFKLMIRRPDESTWLTINKENYRKTSVILLLPVEVNQRKANGRFRYDPDNSDSTRLEKTAFGRFFLSFRQRIQRINLGGFLAYSPYQISLTPGLSTHGMFSSQVINQGSLNLVGGYTAGVDGLEMAGVFNINQKDVTGVQMSGVLNLVGRNASGLQVAGVSNTVLGNVSGVQMAGIKNRADSVQGAQLSGVFNVSKKTEGFQMAGVANRSSGKTGSQFAGAINTGSEVKGIQMAGVLNRSEKMQGLQIAGLLNYSSGETGAQIAGAINIGGKVKGIQLAPLLNVADSSDYPIGLINIIKNGRKSFAIGADESGTVSLIFRSGGRVLYGLVGFGYSLLNDSNLPYATEAGLGAQLLDRKNFAFQMELVNRTGFDLKSHDQSRISLKFLPELYLGSHFGIFAGPTISFTYPDKKDAGMEEIPGWVLYENKINGSALHLGLSGGLMYKW